MYALKPQNFCGCTKGKHLIYERSKGEYGSFLFRDATEWVEFQDSVTWLILEGKEKKRRGKKTEILFYTSLIVCVNLDYMYTSSVEQSHLVKKGIIKSKII